jgi:glycosyltransferase involved in cell wall biosynthesis
MDLGKATGILFKNKFKNMKGKIFDNIIYLKLLSSFSSNNNINILYSRNELISFLSLFFKKSSSKLIFEVNGIHEEEWRNITEGSKVRFSEKIKMLLIINIGNIVYKKADGLIVVTEGIKDYLVSRNIDENKIKVVSNGANTDLFKPITDFSILSQFRKEIELDDDEQVILFVGNLAPWQGVDNLIKAAPMVLEKCIRTKFMIIGDGIMELPWRNLISDLGLESNFIFTGRVNYESVPYYINISDICACPTNVNSYVSSEGGSSLKILEYMACGKPVITGDVKGDADLVVDSNAGLAVVSENHCDLASSLIYLLKNEELRIQMGNNAREAIVEKYSWLKAAEKIGVFCEHILSKE